MRALYQLIVLHLACSERHDNARYHILFPLNKELSWQSLLQYHNKTDMISDLGPNARDFVKEIFVDSNIENCNKIKDNDEDSETREPVFMFNKKWYSIDCDDNRGVKDVTIAIFHLFFISTLYII